VRAAASDGQVGGATTRRLPLGATPVAAAFLNWDVPVLLKHILAQQVYAAPCHKPSKPCERRPSCHTSLNEPIDRRIVRSRIETPIC
jgi:hypothetical protein